MLPEMILRLRWGVAGDQRRSASAASPSDAKRRVGDEERGSQPEVRHGRGTKSKRPQNNAEKTRAGENRRKKRNTPLYQPSKFYENDSPILSFHSAIGARPALFRQSSPPAGWMRVLLPPVGSESTEPGVIQISDQAGRDAVAELSVPRASRCVRAAPRGANPNVIRPSHQIYGLAQGYVVALIATWLACPKTKVADIHIRSVAAGIHDDRRSSEKGSREVAGFFGRRYRLNRGICPSMPRWLLTTQTFTSEKLSSLTSVAFRKTIS